VSARFGMVVLTGTTSGIGAATAPRLARMRGFRSLSFLPREQPAGESQRRRTRPSNRARLTALFRERLAPFAARSRVLP
jgi:NAD(P)-dependent dehydrogenase (short-subunit alcohol dehydrogenase family)